MYKNFDEVKFFMALYLNGNQTNQPKYNGNVLTAVYYNGVKVWPSSGTYYIYNEGTYNCTITPRSFTWNGSPYTYPLNLYYGYDGHTNVYCGSSGQAATQNGVNNARAAFDITNIFIPAGATIHTWGYVYGSVAFYYHSTSNDAYHLMKTLSWSGGWHGHGDINITLPENTTHLSIVGSLGIMEYSMYFVIP